MIKILYFLNSTVRGGVEEHVLSLLEKIDRTRFDPVMAAPPALLDLMESDLQRLDVRSYELDLRSWFNFGEIREYIRILKEEQPHIVHAHLFKAAMFAAPLTKWVPGIKVIDTAHIREEWRKGIKKLFFIDRCIYRDVDKIIAVSHAIKEYLIKQKRLPAHKIVVVHNGVATEKFKTRKKPSSTLTFGVIGRLEEQKGHQYFLQAVRLLGEKANNVEFLIIGEGSLKEQLMDLAQDLKIEKCVRFSGYRKDIVDAYDELDVLVLPSLFEGLPLVALEASAMSKPAIVTDVDGSPEAVLDNETGLVVPARDVNALKAAMEKFIEKRDLVVRLGQKARERAVAHFDVNKQVEETMYVYSNILEGKTS